MSSARPLGSAPSCRPHSPETIDAIRSAAAQGLYVGLIASTLRLPPSTVRRILKREGIDVATGRSGPKKGSKRRMSTVGVAVPGWVPRGLIPDFIANAKMYGEEKAASIVRRLKAEAAR